MRYLGIDYGTRRVGLALSDEAGTMGFPHAIVPSDGRLVDTVRELMIRKSVDAVVIGDSRGLDGVPNPVSEKARAFARTLESLTEVPVYWEPEQFSTQEARRTPEGEYRTGRETVDAAAAALILSSFLSRSNRGTVGA